MSISANPTLAEWDQQTRSDSMNDLLSAAIDAMTGPALTNLAKNATSILTLAERFTAPEVNRLLEAILNNAEALTTMINTLEKWVENGSLMRISEMLDFVRAILDSANGTLVSTIASKAVEMGSLFDQMATSPIMKMAPGAISAMENAYQQVNANSQDVRLGEVIKLFRDPKTMTTLKFLLMTMREMEGSLRSH